jgi:5-methylthioadenosine/S-adenosylhomocysteine deaminase
VMVGGVFKVLDRKVVSVDTTGLRSRILDCVERLAATTSLARVLAGRLEPHVVAFAQSMSREPLSIERRIRPEPR